MSQLGRVGSPRAASSSGGHGWRMAGGVMAASALVLSACATSSDRPAPPTVTVTAAAATTKRMPVAETVSIAPTTLDLADGHYLQLGLELRLTPGQNAARFDQGPAMQLLIDEYSNRSIGSLQSEAMRAQLREELTRKLKGAYAGEIAAVFLTRFEMQ